MTPSYKILNNLGMFEILQVPSQEMVRFDNCSVVVRRKNLEEPSDQIHEKIVPVKERTSTQSMRILTAR